MQIKYKPLTVIKMEVRPECSDFAFLFTVSDSDINLKLTLKKFQ